MPFNYITLGNVTLHIDNSNMGGIDIYRFIKVKNLCQDDFSNTNASSKIWEQLLVNNASVSEQNGELQVSISGGSGWSQAGYVSKYAYDPRDTYGNTQRGFEAVIDVAQLNNLAEMDLLMSNEQTTNSDPFKS